MWAERRAEAADRRPGPHRAAASLWRERREEQAKQGRRYQGSAGGLTDTERHQRPHPRRGRADGGRDGEQPHASRKLLLR